MQPEQKAGEIMVPLEEYATVSQEATMIEALEALEKAQASYTKSPYRHRAVLVLDEEGRVVGKLSQLDVLRGLEPRYGDLFDYTKLIRRGYTRQYITSMVRDHQLLNRPLAALCRRLAAKKVREVMYTPDEGEYVDAEDSLNTAIHQLIVGHHQSLLVTRAGRVAGVLRLTDVFQAVSGQMRS